MRLVKLPKKGGGTRTIGIPSARRKARLRASIPYLQRLLREVGDLNVIHGFCELRSPVTNAIKHIGYQFTLSMDLKDFFDSVKKTHPHSAAVKKLCDKHGWPVWHQGVARQGLPTSPIVANIAATGMDKDIGSWLRCCSGLRHAYTRYADDLTISWDGDAASQSAILAAVVRVAKQHGFAINERKTVLQDASRGRRIITGVAVDDKRIYATRSLKRKLRAAVHNLKHGIVKTFPARQWMKYKKSRAHRGLSALPKTVWLRRWLRSRVCGLQECLALKLPSIGKRSAERISTITDPIEALSEMAARGQ